MSTTTTKLLEDALQLPDRDRADLAARLIESLDPTADDDAQAAWSVEIERRISELEQGSAKAIPWSKAREMILEESDGQSDD